MLGPLVVLAAVTTPDFASAGVVVTTDAIGLAVGRKGWQVEAKASPQSSVAVYAWRAEADIQGEAAFFDFFSSDPTYHLTGLAEGIDLQYRRYLGRRHTAPSGAFIAPGFDVASYRTSTTSCPDASGSLFGDPPPGGPCQGPRVQSWWMLGPTFDAGFQAVAWPGLVLAASAGIRVHLPTADTPDGKAPFWWTETEGVGLRPRFRLSMGWAF
jgi:hypothetical protein